MKECFSPMEISGTKFYRLDKMNLQVFATAKKFLCSTYFGISRMIPPGKYFYLKKSLNLMQDERNLKLISAEKTNLSGFSYIRPSCGSSSWQITLIFA